MYKSKQGGYTVSITKEKFLNTYPPLFNPACLQTQAGRIFCYSIGKFCELSPETILLKKYFAKTVNMLYTRNGLTHLRC